MEIEKLIKHMREEAQDYRSGRTLGRAFADAEDVLDEAATALEQLQAESDRLKEEVQQMRWIPVEERLPKPQENPVIACDYTGVCLAWYSPTMGWQYRTGLSGVDITHWMPLPQPPRRKAMNKICSECPYKDKCEYTTLTPDLRGESCQYYSLAERFGKK